MDFLANSDLFTFCRAQEGMWFKLLDSVFDSLSCSFSYSLYHISPFFWCCGAERASIGVTSWASSPASSRTALQKIQCTVNQLNFAAVNFRRLPIFLYFPHFNFAFWYLRIFPDKMLHLKDVGHFLWSQCLNPKNTCNMSR